MMIIALVAALSQPMPFAGGSPMTQPLALGAAPVVCNPDQSKGLACHMNKAQAHSRAHYAKREAAAASAREARAAEQRDAARLSLQDDRDLPVSN